MIFLTLLLLIVMEVSLSMDNAVLNAKVLRSMSPIWQRRFLTWGMLIAVFGMRLVFPILIVVVASGLPIIDVTNMAINSPELYAAELEKSHISISAFGGMFLLLVFLEFICDSAKDVHWFGWIERKLSAMGLLKGIEVIICAVLLMVIQAFLITPEDKLSCMLSGLSGISLYMIIKSVMGLLETDNVAHIGFMGFMYLEVLDASCSLDGVIGAFALTNNIFIIMIGLGIGALAVRSLTIYLVKGGVLQQYIYLEHGAHYGIGALAAIMLINTVHHVPEPVTGMIGLSFILMSLYSSVKHNRRIA